MNIEQLVKTLQEASDTYYNSVPAIPDAEFDQLVDELRKIDPTHPFLAKIGAKVKTSVWPKVKHKHVMGSQDKVKTKEEFLKWASNKSHMILTDKLDGSTIVLTYKNGQLISAATRGDGTEGEEILSNAVKMQNVKECLDGFSGTLRGEIILPISSFKQHFEPLGYKNARNCAAGLAREKSGTDLLKHLKVVYFDVIDPYTNKIGRLAADTEVVKLTICRYFDLEHVCHTRPLNAEETWVAFEKRMSERASLDFEIDGSVIKENDIAKQTAHGHLNDRPKGMVAIKPESQSKETKIVDIQWQQGLSGRVSPVLIVDPVDIGGVTITRISGNNLDFMRTKNISIGANAIISRRNDVIPYCESITKLGGGNTNKPTSCLKCHESLESDGAYLFCANILCAGKTYGDLMVWLRATKIRGVGPAVLANLIELGVTDVARLVSTEITTFNQACNSDLNGPKIHQQIHDNLEMDLPTLLYGLNVPHVGEINAKRIAKHFDTFKKVLVATVEEMATVPGVKTTAKEIVNSLFDKKDLITELLKYIKIKNGITNGSLSGTSFCITGELSKPREEIQELIRQNGGEVKTGVSKDLSFLVIADPTSTTSKAEKARKYGTKCISEAELYLMIK